MKMIGLIGGMSWESTASYYRYINEEVRMRQGGLHTAKLLLYSLDFHEIEEMQREGRWDQAAGKIVKAAIALERAGAEMLVLCTNTMHKVVNDIEARINIPLLHIADAMGKAIRDAGFETIGFLGTRFSMQHSFYRDFISERYRVRVLVPNEGDQNIVHKVIYEELCQGVVVESSRVIYQKIIHDLVDQGAEGIVLGCAEIGMLIRQDDVKVKIFDSTHIHAKMAVSSASIDYLISSSLTGTLSSDFQDFADTELLV